jgi:hypothetical protein
MKTVGIRLEEFRQLKKGSLKGVTHEKRSQDTILLFPEKPFF